MHRQSYLLITITFLISSFTQAYDNPHFYRATNLFPEPRFERDHLTSIDVHVGGGRTKKGFNNDRESVPLLDIFGTHNMHELGVNVPNLDPNNPLDLILIQLSLLPSNQNFATFSIEGKFKIIEANIALTHNLKKGFFLQLHLPIRRLEVKNINFIDLSPTDTSFPNKNSIEWQRFLTFFDQILQRYNLSKNPFKKTGVGDLTSWFGWTQNYQETEVIDFIDTSVMIGLLANTSKQKNEDELFAIPLGYNGHWGVPLSAMMSIGFYEWVTIGAYLNAIFFVKDTRTIRLKTAPQQSGIIKLAKGAVTVDKGNLWHTGAYFKADHFARGLSFTFAYSFAAQQDDSLTPKNPTLFDPAITNDDEMIKGWKMHTLHFMLEYDFTKQDSKIGNRIGLFYNRQVSGKRTFKTNTAGGTIGMEIGWSL